MPRDTCRLLTGVTLPYPTPNSKSYPTPAHCPTQRHRTASTEEEAENTARNAACLSVLLRQPQSSNSHVHGVLVPRCPGTVLLERATLPHCSCTTAFVCQLKWSTHIFLSASLVKCHNKIHFSLTCMLAKKGMMEKHSTVSLGRKAILSARAKCFQEERAVKPIVKKQCIDLHQESYAESTNISHSLFYSTFISN